jgi:ABC-2 type transport system permease protein
MRGVLEEKSTRVAEVVVSSVSPETLLAGKVIGVGAVGLTQQIIWVVATIYLGTFVAPILTRMAPSTVAATTGASGAAAIGAMSMPDIHVASLLLILVFFVLGYGGYSPLYAAVGASVNSEQEAQQALAPILVLIIASALFIQPVMLNPRAHSHASRRCSRSRRRSSCHSGCRWCPFSRGRWPSRSSASSSRSSR